MSLITSQAEFDSLCQDIKRAGIVAFDTEFVSESYFRPKLCLLQFAVEGRLVGVDPFEVPDLSAWWEIMIDEPTRVVIHGGREEVRFCHFATGQAPRNLIDVQIAEGLRSRGYPISYTNLVSRVLGKNIKHGKETRTDWERRPLTDNQIQYALEDVVHLLNVWELQSQTLKAQGRLDWAFDEFQRFIERVMGEEERDGWDRLPGYGRLNRREMQIAQDMYAWRREQAAESNRPQRRVFRDDMLIEVAKRQPKSVRELNMTRGMKRRDYQQYADEIIAVVNNSLRVPDGDLPQKISGPQYPAQDEVLARILGLALANRCEQMGVSITLVGTTSDLKQLVRWHVFDKRQGEMPKLQEGWRGKMCGQLLSDVLDGKISMRVKDATAECPISFDTED